ncbi:hypothetical protein ACPUYX_14250 [Desulfosporosinus sp. SYSU MS00001]|uniref:hypothetical protein n=1 Tax=Desulfosporosinus sp. SYSU MS00001 TaxID=3416284 RepID=UPI003CF3B1BD
MLEIAALLKNKKPNVSKKISSIKIPNWVIYLAALFNKRANEAALFLRMSRNVSNEKAKRILGLEPIPNNEETIPASINSMIKF